MSNEQLYDAALKAITTLFSDQSVSQEEAANNLRALRDEINIMLDTLEE
jgi:hypothetical protein